MFPNTNPASYLVVPVPFPGIEGNGRVSLDTALGQPQISQITGESILFQRARLNTNTSNDPDDLARGLKSGDEFTVTGLFDLMELDLARERHSIRLVDFASGAPNDNLQLSVGLTSQGDWRVQFLEADFDAGLLNELGDTASPTTSPPSRHSTR